MWKKKKIYSDHGKIKKKKIIFFPASHAQEKKEKKRKRKRKRKEEEKSFGCVKGNKQALKKSKA